MELYYGMRGLGQLASASVVFVLAHGFNCRSFGTIPVRATSSIASLFNTLAHQMSETRSMEIYSEFGILMIVAVVLASLVSKTKRQQRSNANGRCEVNRLMPNRKIVTDCARVVCNRWSRVPNTLPEAT